VHIINWILDKSSNRHKIRQARFRNKSKKTVDGAIKFCVMCNHTWEIIRLGNNLKSLSKYENVPSIGKAKEPCPKCKENEANH
tara:strand:- start:3207 stop:3455 length:249 start_codon:yes stop_codon:yes gene_type:complete